MYHKLNDISVYLYTYRFSVNADKSLSDTVYVFVKWGGWKKLLSRDPFFKCFLFNSGIEFCVFGIIPYIMEPR